MIKKCSASLPLWVWRLLRSEARLKRPPCQAFRKYLRQTQPATALSSRQSDGKGTGVATGIMGVDTANGGVPGCLD